MKGKNEMEGLIYNTFGKSYRVTKIFTNVAECNEHCEKTNDGVIATIGEMIICVNMEDNGTK